LLNKLALKATPVITTAVFLAPVSGPIDDISKLEIGIESFEHDADINSSSAMILNFKFFMIVFLIEKHFCHS
jgi:hypothetical protein